MAAARRGLCEAVREWFPGLRPRATVNAEHVECWTKEGDLGALAD
ncbi:MAG: hypothetical protein ACYDA8_09660 [Deferrisomatales bacterium]